MACVETTMMTDQMISAPASVRQTGRDTLTVSISDQFRSITSALHVAEVDFEFTQCCDRNNADESSNISEIYFFVVKYIVQVVMECIFQCPFNWTGIDIELCNTVYFLSPTP